MAAVTENTDQKGLSIGLVSGERFQVHGILLGDEALVTEINQLLVQARQLLGPVDTGLGLIGSPGWVAAGLLTFAMFGGVARKKNRTKALELLKNAELKRRHLMETWGYFAPKSIRNIELPYPQEWRAVAEATKTYELASMSYFAMGKLRVNRQEARKKEAQRTETVTFCHIGGDFVLLDTSRGPVNVRWSAVEIYEPS